MTFLALALGAAALISGLRRRFPAYGAFLGHTRFSNYFMIAIFPIQTLTWPGRGSGGSRSWSSPSPSGSSCISD
ncbi:MAG: hypothetical protein FJ398_23130 [Verrucomicrobia bacterium]|nr:hypothetical protein [Verrucomicrobiota bacterium]